MVVKISGGPTSDASRYVADEKDPASVTASQETQRLAEAGAVSEDALVRNDGSQMPRATSLPPVSVPSQDLDTATIVGAQTFASQIGSMESSNDSNDLMAAFLKLNVGGDAADRQSNIDIDQARSILHQLAIETARKLMQIACKSPEAYQALQAALAQIEYQTRWMNTEAVRKQQRDVKETAEAQMNGDEDKSSSEEKRTGKFKRTATKGGTPGVAVATSGVDGGEQFAAEFVAASDPASNILSAGRRVWRGDEPHQSRDSTAVLERTRTNITSDIDNLAERKRELVDLHRVESLR